MGSFEIKESHSIAPQAAPGAIGNLWSKESHNDFIAAGRDKSNKDNPAKLDNLLSCTDCNKKGKQTEDNTDSNVEPQLKLVAPENIEKDKHYGDTRPPKTIIFFIDNSGSMNDHIAGPDSPTKIDAITEACQEYLPQIPADVQVGLATLGTDLTGSSETPSFTVLVEPATNSGDKIVNKMRNIVPHGGTPIAYGFQKMKEHCYQANGAPTYSEPIWIIYGGDGGENYKKQGESDACDEVHEWLKEKPQGIAVRAIGIAIEKNPPEQVEEAKILFDCLNGSKAVNAHKVDDIVKELKATPGSLTVSNPDVDQKVHAKLLHTDINGKLHNPSGNATDANGKQPPPNNTSSDSQQVYGEVIQGAQNAKNTVTPQLAPGSR